MKALLTSRQFRRIQLSNSTMCNTLSVFAYLNGKYSFLAVSQEIAIIRKYSGFLRLKEQEFFSALYAKQGYEVAYSSPSINKIKLEVNDVEKALWYKSPAKRWEDGLPIGNGRLAAMIFGDEKRDVLALNHEWLWRGKNRNRDNIKGAHMLEEIRSLLRKGDFFRATDLSNVYFAGGGGMSAIKGRVDAYQPAGNLVFEIINETSYVKRELDIENAVACVKRTNLDAHFIAHPEYNNIICRWKGDFSCRISYSRVLDDDAAETCDIKADGIEYTCSFNEGISFKTTVTIKTDGQINTDNNFFTVKDAKELIAFIDIEIAGQSFPAPLDMEWSDILARHSAKFSNVINRACIYIDSEPSELETSVRIENLRNGADDPALILLFVRYGQYLLASSSISGELPANLQGKWNYLINPPWQSDYHFDINIQMNYWMAEPFNMSESIDTLLRFVESFVAHGKKAAMDLYGCRGVWLPLQTDAWGRATPESYGWAAWIGAAPWIAQHFWWRYIYSGDVEFLRDRAYPFFREVALFLEDYLVEDTHGEMQIMPSQSPENRFEGTGHFPVSIGISSAMDVQLAYDALGYAIKSATILGVDSGSVANWSSIREKLPNFNIGSDGRLLEWDVERNEIEPGHRHLSHLYGLYPSNIFNPIDRPEQYEAAIKSFDYRMAHGGGHTGWSRAWAACVSAQIGRGDEMWQHLNEMIKEFATQSLLDLHPPQIFQIDGNLGAAAALSVTLVNCHADKIYFLPALPKAMNSGGVKGLKVPGGHTISFTWHNARVEEIEIIMGFVGEVTLCIPNLDNLTIKGELDQKHCIRLG